MSVAELVAVLQQLVAADADVAGYEVWTEGCDCDGDVDNVLVRVRQKDVYLRRS